MSENKRMLELEKLGDDFRALIEKKDLKAARELLLSLNEIDIADLIDEMDPVSGAVLYRMLPKDLAAEVFAYFDSEQQKAIIDVSTDVEIKDILDDLNMDDMVDMLEEMPASVVNKILKYTSPEERNLINVFLKYPQDSAGSIMTIEYVSLKKKMTVAEALEKIRREGIDKETVYTLYVTDKERRLEGILSLRELLVANDDDVIEDLMESDVIYAHTHDDREDVANLFRKYGFKALPIVDNERRVVGIVTVDDIMEVMESETTEDFQKMAATTPNESPYLLTSPLTLAKHRIPWLLVLMISSTITQNIINGYEHFLSSIPFLAGFIPMLMDTGGNSGAQSSTLVIRGMATGDIRGKDWFKVLWKEMRVALLCGVTLAFVNYFKVIYLDGVPADVALTVSCSLVVAVLGAKLVGGLLPIAAASLKLDPAIMASPLITTIADATSLTAYFIFAQMIIK